MATERRATVLLATMSEADTIESVLQEVAESVHRMSRFGWVFDVLIVDDGTDESFPGLCGGIGQTCGLQVRGTFACTNGK